MDLVFDGLKSVTVRAPDYETLMVIQASRRLYKPPGQSLNLSQVVELNKRFIMGYNAYRDEPRVQALYKEVQKYNTNLRRLGLKDHQVRAGRRVSCLFCMERNVLRADACGYACGRRLRALGDRTGSPSLSSSGARASSLPGPSWPCLALS